MQEAKKSLGGKCALCGSTRSLQLDHKSPGRKSFSITKLWGVAEDEFKREVKKCRLLCQSCHRKHTGKQREEGVVKSKPGKTSYDTNGRKKKKSKKASFLSLALRVLKVADTLTVPESEARLLGENLYADWSRVPFPEFYKGLLVELKMHPDKEEAARKALDNLALSEDFYLKKN